MTDRIDQIRAHFHKYGFGPTTGELLDIVESLRDALEKVAQLQRDKCENASAEMLFMLLDNKVDIACAALAKLAVKP